MEKSTIFKFGKPSISIRAIYTMAMLVITRGYSVRGEVGGFCNSNLPGLVMTNIAMV